MIILQPVSSSESSSQKSMIIGSMTLLSIQFSLQYSVSILTTCSSAFVHTSFEIFPKAGVSRQSNPHFAYLHAKQSKFAFTRGYFWCIRPIIRKPHIICAVILINPCFIHVHDIIPCFPKRFDLFSDNYTYH